MAFGTVKLDSITTSTQTLTADNLLENADIGVSVQAYDANLPAGNVIVVDSDIGSTVQAYNAKLAAVAGLAVTDGNIIVGDGSTFVAESGATARTSLGVPGLAGANTFTAAQTLNAGLTVDGPYKQVSEAVGALDIDLSTGNYFTKTISANSTFTFSNPPSSGTVGSFVLELTHTSGTVTWPSSVKFPADTAPTLTTGKTHLFFFVTDDGGTRYRGASLVDYVN